MTQPDRATADKATAVRSAALWPDKIGGWSWVGGHSNDAYWEKINRPHDIVSENGQPKWRVWISPIADPAWIEPGWGISYRHDGGRKAHFVESVADDHVIARGASAPHGYKVPHCKIDYRWYATSKDWRITEYTYWNDWKH